MKKFLFNTTTSLVLQYEASSKNKFSRENRIQVGFLSSNKKAIN